MAIADLRDGGAPSPLDVVAGFVNTRAITRSSPTAREDLGTPEALDRWGRAHLGLAGSAPCGPEELAEAHVVREGLRALLARHNDASLPGDDQAVTAFTRATDAVRLVGSPVGEPLAGASRGITASLLARIVTARLTGDWARLKVCRDPHCREAFHDGSKNRSRAWCSMAVCGARSKQRAMTARRRAG